MQSDDKNSYYDQKEYIGRSVHYWKFVLPLLEKIKERRNIPEPPDPLFIHFPSKHIPVRLLAVCHTTFLKLVWLSPIHLCSFTLFFFVINFFQM